MSFRNFNLINIQILYRKLKHTKIQTTKRRFRHKEIHWKVLNDLFTTSEHPKYSNSNPPNLLLWFFCLIKSRVNCSEITQPFLNPNLIFFSDAKLFVAESLKRIKTKIWRVWIQIFLRFWCRKQVKRLLRITVKKKWKRPKWYQVIKIKTFWWILLQCIPF